MCVSDKLQINNDTMAFLKSGWIIKKSKDTASSLGSSRNTSGNKMLILTMKQ
jgi:hypothetical protein